MGLRLSVVVAVFEVRVMVMMDLLGNDVDESVYSIFSCLPALGSFQYSQYGSRFGVSFDQSSGFPV